jgi:hypothetical protein
MTTEKFERFKSLGAPRRFKHGDRCFPNVRLVTDDELPPERLAQVRALRKRGLTARYYIDPDSGYTVGVAADKSHSDGKLRKAAMHQMAYAEFQGLIDFDLFKVILAEDRAELWQELDEAQPR